MNEGEKIQVLEGLLQRIKHNAASPRIASASGGASSAAGSDDDLFDDEVIELDDDELLMNGLSTRPPPPTRRMAESDLDAPTPHDADDLDSPDAMPLVQFDEEELELDMDLDDVGFGEEKTAVHAADGIQAQLIAEVTQREAQEQHQAELRKADEERRAEVARRADEARAAEKARADREAQASQAQAAEQARQAEEARRAEAEKAEQERKAEEARRAEQQRVAAAEHAAQERKAEEARQVEAARKAQEAHQAEALQKAEDARIAQEAQQARQGELARLAEEAPISTRQPRTNRPVDPGLHDLPEEEKAPESGEVASQRQPAVGAAMQWDEEETHDAPPLPSTPARPITPPSDATDVRLIAGPEDVRPQVIRRSHVASGDVASFLGATRESLPERFGDLLDEALRLGL